ncbi:hypothetical protein N7528_004356 [Penicillium herquei]|nr:hypothetical protein N7528_004356 [Penicillium herquei]
MFQSSQPSKNRKPKPLFQGKKLTQTKQMIYTSQELGIPEHVRDIFLCDLGSTVHGDQYHTALIQPKIYRATYMSFGVPETFSVDIWNVDYMIWDLYEGRSLFTGQDPEFERYRN